MTEKYEGVYEGKRYRLVQTVRVRHVNKSWGYYNRMILRFEDGTATTVPAAEFARKAKPLSQAAE